MARKVGIEPSHVVARVLPSEKAATVSLLQGRIFPMQVVGTLPCFTAWVNLFALRGDGGKQRKRSGPDLFSLGYNALGIPLAAGGFFRCLETR